jgi:hypothetical protein
MDRDREGYALRSPSTNTLHVAGSAFKAVDTRGRSTRSPQGENYSEVVHAIQVPSFAATETASKIDAASSRDVYSEDGRGGSIVPSKPISCRQFVSLLQRKGIVPRLEKTIEALVVSLTSNWCILSAQFSSENFLSPSLFLSLSPSLLLQT